MRRVIDNNLKNLTKKLKGCNIKLSQQRLQILKFIITNPCHPTIDQIFAALHDELPTLSKTTIYNTLKLFADAGLAQEITIENNEVRYDAKIESHGHFKCKICGKIYDFNISIDDIPTEGLNDFQIETKHVYFKGICKDCLRSK